MLEFLGQLLGDYDLSPAGIVGPLSTIRLLQCCDTELPTADSCFNIDPLTNSQSAPREWQIKGWIQDREIDRLDKNYYNSVCACVCVLNICLDQFHEWGILTDTWTGKCFHLIVMQGQGVRAQVALSVFVNTAHAAVCRCYVLFLFFKTCKKEKHTCLTIACTMCVRL